MTPLILASASPRRRELLERIGIAVEVRPADIDETPIAGEAPKAYVARVAAAKCAAIVDAPSDAWILAADTIVQLDDEIFGKAADADAARAMLRRLAGRRHSVSTAFVLRHAGSDRVVAELVTTSVDMIAMSDAMIDDYVASNEWRGKAGAYAIQGIAAALVAGIVGSVTNVIGLPLSDVVAAFARVGGPVPRFVDGTAS